MASAGSGRNLGGRAVVGLLAAALGAITGAVALQVGDRGLQVMAVVALGIGALELAAVARALLRKALG